MTATRLMNHVYPLLKLSGHARQILASSGALQRLRLAEAGEATRVAPHARPSHERTPFTKATLYSDWPSRCPSAEVASCRLCHRDFLLPSNAHKNWSNRHHCSTACATRAAHAHNTPGLLSSHGL